jgi:hypothetical protein
MIQTRPMTSAEIAARDGHPSVFLTPPSIAEHMAANMLDIAAINDGRCCDTDLMLRGFTAGEIARYGAEANRIAILAAVGRRH